MSESIREEEPMLEAEAEGTLKTVEPSEDLEGPSLVWHGFLNRFLLFFLPAIYVFQAVWIFTGRAYYTADVRERIYEGICGMRALDRGLCVFLLGAAALLLAARWKLKRMRGSGVRLLLSGLGMAALAWAIYGIVRLLIAGLSPLSVSVAGQCAVYTALLLVNRHYYARRKGVLTDENDGRKEKK